MACCVISFTALTDLSSWYRTIDSLYTDRFEVDPAGPGRTALASPRARASCHRGSRHRPRVSRQAHHGKCHGNVHSEVLRVARHTVGPIIFALPMDHRTTNNMVIRRWREAEPLPFCFHCPGMCMVVFFPRKCVCCHSRC